MSTHNERTELDLRLQRALYGEAGQTWTDASGNRHLVEGGRQYTYSLDACACAEAEIARRGLLQRYGYCLLKELQLVWADPTGHYQTREEIALIATAPPDVRVRAMLRVLEG